MSFQACIDNIVVKTGLKPVDFRKRAAAKGFLADGGIAPGVKATKIADWLKAELGLGHGHAVATYAIFKGREA